MSVNADRGIGTRCVAIVQARMTSTRLPGKILAEIDGAPMLAHHIRRLSRSRRLDAIVIATTTNESDNPVMQLAKAEGVDAFRGDEHDVLARFCGAAREFAADVVVRLTGDCPLIDSDVVDQVIARALDGSDRCDYASNTIERTYPRGLDVEALHRDVLERVERLAQSTPAREHVTFFIHGERPNLFELRQVKRANNDSDLRWTVDTDEDLLLIRRMFSELGAAHASTEELIQRLRSRQDLVALNRNVIQKST